MERREAVEEGLKTWRWVREAWIRPSIAPGDKVEACSSARRTMILCMMSRSRRIERRLERSKRTTAWALPLRMMLWAVEGRRAWLIM